MRKLPLTLLLALGSLGGCGELTDEPVDDTVVETSAALTTNPFKLHNYQTNLCMGVAAGTPTVGTKLVTWTCDNSANQTWHKGGAATASPDFFLLVNHVAEDRCLHNHASDGDQSMIAPCAVGWWHESFKPIFSFSITDADNVTHECYRFASLEDSTKVIGVIGGHTTPGSQIMMWGDFNNRFTHPDQFWCIY